MSAVKYFWIFSMISFLFQHAHGNAEAEQLNVTLSSNEQASCFVYKGYDISPGFDIDMIYNSNNEKCCKSCYEREGCVSWTMFERKCHLKGTNVLVKARLPEQTVSGIRATEASSNIIFSDKGPTVQSPSYATGKKSECTLHSQYAIEGEDLKDVGYKYLSECCHICGTTELCSGWTHTGTTCMLKKGNKLVKGGPFDVSGVLLDENDAPSSS